MTTRPMTPGHWKLACRQMRIKITLGFIGGFVSIWDGNHLEAGDVLMGPSVVERYGDTVIIPPKFKGEVDSWGIIILTKVK